jgi:heme oxygenase
VDLPDAIAGLRQATAAAHHRLEQDLGLLRPPLARERFVALLKRFWGFHTAWEPAMARHPDLAETMRGRSRLGVLREDLRSLGLCNDQIDALPRCAEAGELAPTPAAALGALYVIEGSTLGGQLISRALQDAAWLPPKGLTYFHPYGPETGAKWRTFQNDLRGQATPPTQPAIEQAAIATFECLRGWLTA